MPTSITPAISSAGHYAKIVQETALLRQLIYAAGDIAELAARHFVERGANIIATDMLESELHETAELVKAKGVGEEVQATDRFVEVVAVIVGMNLLFSIDSILTVVGMTDIFAVMAGSVVISVALMLAFAKPLARFLSENPDFEILGLFVLLLIGFVLFLEGGHVAHATVADSEFPYIPQWITIFILLLMFTVDFYQNWLERKREQAPVELRRRKK